MKTAWIPVCKSNFTIPICIKQEKDDSVHITANVNRYMKEMNALFGEIEANLNKWAYLAFSREEKFTQIVEP